MRISPAAIAAALIVPLAVAGCTVVQKDDEQITIEHLASQFAIAQAKANDYCAEKGRKAMPVMTSPRQSSFLLVQTSTSVFKCVEAAQK